MKVKKGIEKRRKKYRRKFSLMIMMAMIIRNIRDERRNEKKKTKQHVLLFYVRSMSWIHGSSIMSDFYLHMWTSRDDDCDEYR